MAAKKKRTIARKLRRQGLSKKAANALASRASFRAARKKG
jgi:hypothetical protein